MGYKERMNETHCPIFSFHPRMISQENIGQNLDCLKETCVDFQGKILVYKERKLSSINVYY